MLSGKKILQSIFKGIPQDQRKIFFGNRRILEYKKQ